MHEESRVLLPAPGGRQGESLSLGMLSLEMLDPQLGPADLQILGDKPAMTLMRFGLAAEQAAVVKILYGLVFSRIALAEKVIEPSFVFLPVEPLFLSSIEEFARRSELDDVVVRDVSRKAKEIFEMLLFGEAGEL